MPKIRSKEVTIFIVAMIFLYFTGLSQGSANGSIVGANVIQGTQIQMPAGCELYVYGMSTGGAISGGPFANGTTILVTNLSGVVSDGLCVSTATTNSFQTYAPNHAIGGFGIKDANYIQGFYGFNPGPGPGEAGMQSMETVSVNFTLNTPALVILIGMASSQEYISFSGITDLSTDAYLPNPSPYPDTEISIAHSYLNPGNYSVEEKSTAFTPGQTPNNQADLMGVLICSDTPFAATSNNPKIPIPISTTPTTLSSTISTPQFSFSLKNGITLTGEFISDSINVQNPFFSSKISIYGIEDINVNSNGTFTIVLKDGSKIIATTVDQTFSVETNFSPNIVLSWDEISSIDRISK